MEAGHQGCTLRLESAPYPLSYFLEFVLTQLQLWSGKIDIIHRPHRNQMDMNVRHLQSDHGHPDSGAFYGLVDGFRHFLREDIQLGQGIGLHVKDVVGLLFWYDQYVAFDQGHDVQKGDAVIVLCDNVRRNLSIDNLREDTCHDFSKKNPGKSGMSFNM